MNNKKNIVGIVISLICGAMIMYGAIYFFPQQFSTTVTKTEKDVTITDEGIADAVDKVYDSVVVVSAYKETNGDKVLYSSGTGFVYEINDGKAYILTNSHVIEGTNSVTVTLTDGNVLETNVIGANSYEDIAVLEINEEDVLKVAELGSSEDLLIGDTSFAVGAPLDSAFSWTVTRGIISGKDRFVEVSTTDSSTPDYVMKVLQTDAAINSGNSGGPLCNSNGEVIGINTLKLASDGVEGMGFAIPIEQALETAQDIIDGKSTSQPYLGVAMLDFSSVYASADFRNFQNIVEESGLDNGIIITEVVPNSAAANAGLEVGDIITHVEDTEVKSISYFKYELYKYNVNDKIELTYFRDGKSYTANVTLGTSQITG